MPCTCPLSAWPAAPGAADRRLVFSPSKSYQGAQAIEIPCGQCDGCRSDKGRDLATRGVHEASLHEANCFISPTYSDGFLPDDLSVSVREAQLFKKRLAYFVGKPVRSILCGEYGGRTQRPHYHAILFGVDFREDRYAWKRSPSGELLYRSPLLEKAWPYGHCLIGDVNSKSIGYCTRYQLKKLGKGRDDPAYQRQRVDPATGELRSWWVDPEFLLLPRRPGLGRDWFDRFASDAFPSDFLIVEGSKRPVPRYYLDRLAAAEGDAAVERIKAARRERAAVHAANNTEARLLTRHEVGALRVARLVNTLDDEE